MSNVNFAAMSDEEIEKFDIASVETATEEKEEETLEEETVEEAVAEEKTAEEEIEEVEEEKEESTEKKEEASSEEADEETEKESTEGVKTPEAGIDYKVEYEKLLAPFKAGGREMQVKSVDEALQLMQKGVDYHNKMASLKPSLKIIKTLQNAELLDVDNVNFLIDLHKKKPEAIAKLLKDSNIDPIDIDMDKGEGYKPSQYQPSDQQLMLDEVLENIRDTPSYSKTLNVVAKVWDEESRNTVLKHPQILEVINGHIESGVYDIIQTEMEKERIFGNLRGLSDLAAYKQVGDMIEARGGFRHLSKAAPAAQGAKAPIRVTGSSPKQRAESAELAARKRAAAPPKGASRKSEVDDLLNLPDDEFEKQFNAQFLH